MNAFLLSSVGFKCHYVVVVQPLISTAELKIRDRRRLLCVPRNVVQRTLSFAKPVALLAKNVPIVTSIAFKAQFAARLAFSSATLVFWTSCIGTVHFSKDSDPFCTPKFSNAY